ncbi:MAG: transposase [Flavobacteriales bacterium]|nr:transposase [Flavobacteriales bacterium]
MCNIATVTISRQAHQIYFVYIQPGKPTQNAYVERFNGSYRRGVLNAHVFQTLDQVRMISEIWL